ncbi:hypothetical protein JAAARDRAFT_390032 [Jaapia argillacea MUCL 33604]|uniref:Uncharacterized protein n=1 Tax=Jaapia argillacea MUCL 33604 TaxID=933084 RepID=A0A067Q9L8_9AGAM|nr:hypothetical protein JAAARDRAFT_390032 [Jaapia argillacea MUCL 33604]
MRCTGPSHPLLWQAHHPRFRNARPDTHRRYSACRSCICLTTITWRSTWSHVIIAPHRGDSQRFGSDLIQVPLDKFFVQCGQLGQLQGRCSGHLATHCASVISLRLFGCGEVYVWLSANKRDALPLRDAWFVPYALLVTSLRFGHRFPPWPPHDTLPFIVLNVLRSSLFSIHRSPYSVIHDVHEYAWLSFIYHRALDCGNMRTTP